MVDHMKYVYFSLLLITFCVPYTWAMRRAAHDSAATKVLKLGLKYNAPVALARILTRFKRIQATIFVPFDAWPKMGGSAKKAASGEQLHQIQTALNFLEPVEEALRGVASHPELYDCFLTLEEKQDDGRWQQKNYSLPELIAFLRGFLTSHNLEMLARFRVKTNRTPSPVVMSERDGTKKECEKSPTPSLDDDGHGVGPKGEPRPTLRQPVSNIHTIHQPGRPPKVTPNDLIVQKRTNYLVSGVTAVLGITIAVLFVLYRWFQRPILKKPVSNNVITPINPVNTKLVPDNPNQGWLAKFFATPTASNEDFELRV